MTVLPGNRMAGIGALRPWHYVLTALLALALYLPGFAAIPPFDRDESRFAQASRQMVESGDFVDIRFQDEARYKKPIGIYWLQSAAVALTGGDSPDAIWKYRLPSLIGAVAAVLLTLWTGSRLFGPSAGLVAAGMLACCVLMGVEARMAKTDAVLLACVVAAQSALARIYLDRAKPIGPGWGLLALFWGAQGVGILVKGPIAPLVSAGTVLALWALDRRLDWLRRLRPAFGAALVALIVLPWLVAIAVASGGEFLSYAVGHELLGKVNTGQEGHAGPPGYHLAFFWLMFWPFSLIAALALPWAWRSRLDPAVRFCIAWILPTWLLFEIVLTKLPHYVLPTYPAIALLAARFLVAGWQGLAQPSGSRAAQAGRGAVVAFYLLVPTAALAVVAAGIATRLGGTVTPASLAAGAALAGAGLALVAARARPRALAGTVLAALAGLGLTFGMVMPGLDAAWVSPRAAAAIAAHSPCPTPTVAAAGYTEPSLVFLVGTRTRLGGGGDAADLLATDPACGIALVTDGAERDAFLARARERDVTPREVARLAGFNYSRGKPVSLGLYRAEAAP